MQLEVWLVVLEMLSVLLGLMLAMWLAVLLAQLDHGFEVIHDILIWRSLIFNSLLHNAF